MKKNIILSIIICSLQCVIGQQDAQYTQYMYNTISINPAYTGTRGILSFIGLHRSQWVGLDGAPKTQTIAIHSPIGRKQKIGAGLSVINDHIGPSRETYFDMTFSYMLNISNYTKLSLGLKAGGHLLDVNFSGLNRFTDDILIRNDIENKFSPNIGVGAYYFSDKYYIGLSAPNLLETEHFNEIDSRSRSFIATERINYYLIGGYVFNLNEDLKFKPTFLGKMVTGAPLQVDLSANFLFRKKLTLGAAWRWSAALSGMAGFQISNQLMIGLAYDREITQLGNTQFNDGSFEFFLRFEILRRYELLSPRFF